MFTGLVETVGEIVAVTGRKGSSRLTVASDLPGGDIRIGESVSVDGVCLTVVDVSGGKLRFDAVAETLARTTLGAARPGRRVNLERALRLGDRLGGHLVQGHVDAVARVMRVVARGDDWRVRVGFVPAIRPYVAMKGSVAVQGVSLTVSALGRSGFEVALIPETLRRTTLGALRAGDPVNVEVDLVARYLERLTRSTRSRTP